MASQIPGDVTFSFLSGASGGNPAVSVSATGSPGTLVHTAVSGTDDLDLIELTLFNTDTSANVTATVEVGSTQIAQTVTRGSSLTLPLVAANNGVVLRAFCSSATALVITGRVFRITDGAL